MLRCGEHPRVCGDHFPNAPTPGYVSGTPPRARGPHGQGVRAGRHAGNTPACAGTTRRSVPNSRAGGEHPRVRGDHTSCPSARLTLIGTPPRARGPHCVSWGFSWLLGCFSLLVEKRTIWSLVAACWRRGAGSAWAGDAALVVVVRVLAGRGCEGHWSLRRRDANRTERCWSSGVVSRVWLDWVAVGAGGLGLRPRSLHGWELGPARRASAWTFAGRSADRPWCPWHSSTRCFREPQFLPSGQRLRWLSAVRSATWAMST